MANVLSPLAAARHLCERSGWTLTNLQLQKILYLAHMQYLGETGEPLINGTFEAWDYGPVLPQVYGTVKIYGDNPIKNAFGSVGKIENPQLAKALDDRLEELKSYTAGRLVDETHWSHGAWAACYRPGAYGVPIPSDLIKWEYRNRVLAANSQQPNPN